MIKKEDIELSVIGSRIILSANGKILLDKNDTYISDIYLAVFKALGCEPYIDKREKYSLIFYGANVGITFINSRIYTHHILQLKSSVEHIRDIINIAFEKFEELPKWSGKLF